MSKRKPIVWTFADSKRVTHKTEIKWVGPPRPTKKHLGYLRFSMKDANGKETAYLGSPSDSELRRIYGWIKTHLESQ